MNTFMNGAKRFLKSEEGPTATEYAVMLALVIVALIGVITAFKDKVAAVFTTVGNAI